MDRLRRSRGVLRAAATRLISSATEALQAEHPSPSDLQVILDDLQDKDSALAALNEMIADLMDDGDEYEAEATVALEYHDKIRNTMSRVRFILNSAARAGDSATPSVLSDTATQGVSTQASSRAPLHRVALPKLQVPVFSGELREWQGFWEHFEATIHNNRELSDIEKFSYLRSYLTGTAKRAIEGVRLAEANYAVAVKLLQERFGRHTALVDDHIDCLLAIAPIDRSSQVSQLRELYEEVHFRTSCLDSLGVPASEYAVILHRVLMRSLPEDIAILYRQRMKETEPDDGATPRSRQEEVRKVMKFLQVQVESREESHASRSRCLPKTTSAGQGRCRPCLPPPVPSALALAAGSASNEHPCCVLCDDRDHTIKDCHATLSAHEIRRRLAGKNCCFKCGREGHVARMCRNAAWIKCKLCSKRHLSVLCAIWNQDRNYPSPESRDPLVHHDPTKSVKPPVTSAPASSDMSAPVLMQTATVWASGKHNSVLVRLLLDTGSQRTFIRRDLSKRLDLPSLGTEDLSLWTFGTSKCSRPYSCRSVKLELHSRFDSRSVTVDALEVPEVCTVKTPAIGPDLLAQLRERKMFVADDNRLGDRPIPTISVLIGSDCYWRIVTGRIERLRSDLCAVETVFGWLVQGVYPVRPANALPNWNCSASALFLACERNGQAEPDIADPTEMWRLDAIGITDPQDTAGVCDQTAMTQFTQYVHKEAGRYVVPLMIRHQGRLTSTNRSVAENRLRRQLQRFDGQQELLQEYDRTISEYFKEGHAERVDTSREPEATVYYLPHHAVIRREAITTKIRVVFDASSHERGESSLNDILDKGVKLGAELLQLLVQFRMNPIILTADIRKAFLQISIRPEDRDALRFLWVDRLPGDEGKIPSIVEWRMTRVPFGASSSPFLLSATLQHHFEMWKRAQPIIATRLKTSFYVDDLVIGASTEEEALEIYRAALAILADASMELRKWCSNSSVLCHQFLKDNTSLDTIGEAKATTKLLGLVWDREADDIVLTTKAVSEYVAAHSATKRTILQSFARIYDPLGLMAPFIIRAKLLFQQLWRRNSPWDEPLPEDVEKQWEGWTSELPTLSSLRIPRCVICHNPRQISPFELHLFCDASPLAYGVAVYMRYEIRGGTVKVQLLMSKCRVAPLKTTSLPRLELLACLLAARLWNYLRGIPETSSCQGVFWSDSSIALHWIAADARRWETFVRNRVLEIQRLTSGYSWRHCAGTDNPADLLTRGVAAQLLTRKFCWWTGPTWLSQPHLQWPANICSAPSPEALSSETSEEISACPTAVVVLSSPPHEPLLEVASFGRLSRLLRVTAWIMRFRRNASQNMPSCTGPLTASELHQAEMYWLRHVQHSAFAIEVKALEEEQRVPNTSSVLTLQPFLDRDRLLRVGGRLQQLNDREELKHPILLPSDHRFTDLLVDATHVRLLHGGVQLTLLDLRERFWILKGRRTVKRVLKACLACRRRRLLPEAAPVAPLPRERISEATPFEVVGIDFCGPLYCRAELPSTVKVYIVVFSCAVTRAVHLELTTDMTAQAFLLAFRRFAARRGIPAIVHSDNAKTFRCSAKHLCSPVKDNVQDYASSHRIQWRFIAECAPWWGGFWERVIRTIKDALKRCLGRSSLSYNELLTVLAEVEAAVNCRPLTYLEDDVTSAEVLTPSHFLVGKRLVTLPTEQENPALIADAPDLRRRARHREQLLRRLWKQWKKEYLLFLRSAHHSKPVPSSNLKPDDLVVVEDINTPPMAWKMGRVVKAFQGRDGIARSFLILLSNGQQVRRPIQRLYLLEAHTCSAAAGV